MEDIKQVRICGVPFKVNYVDDPFTVGGDSYNGEICHQTLEIKVNSKLPDELKKVTLCHEIAHGMFVLLGRNDLSNDETLVTAMGTALAGTFDVMAEK